MTTSTETIERPAIAASATDTESPFADLDITFLETGPSAAMLVASTDDNCGSSCPNACTTSSS
ncbi:FxLD family lanthipeptide [Catenulispora rubra]|uniref:FxLD family lanthipeptide n=1 Tax=Catenulispora rubra TaxID=280293 RepID=UPI0018925572|nr:FxLD family lanthipeptide [Catenulispora rubra]